MKILPYFVYSLKSSKTIDQLMEFITLHSKEEKYLDINSESNNLIYSKTGKNSFQVTNKNHKWLAVYGSLQSKGGKATIRLTFRKHLVAIIFQLFIIIFLTTQLIVSEENKLEFGLLLFIIYITDLFYFNWVSGSVKNHLIRIFG